MDIECNFYGSYLRWPLGYKLINNWVWTLSSGFVSDIKITILHSCHLWYSNDHYIGAVYQSNNMARLNTLRPNSIWEEWEVNITEIVLGRGGEGRYSGGAAHHRDWILVKRSVSRANFVRYIIGEVWWAGPGYGRNVSLLVWGVRLNLHNNHILIARQK